MMRVDLAEDIPVSVTHVAGPVVVINGRHIQRCSACGHKLREARDNDGEPGLPAMWRVGALVCCEGDDSHSMTRRGQFEATSPLPADFCTAPAAPPKKVSVTREQIEDAASSLFVTDEGAEGHRLVLWNAKAAYFGESLLQPRGLEEVVDLLCHHLGLD